MSLYQVWDIYFQNWNNGRNLKLWRKSMKIQNIFQKFICTVDGHDRTDFWIQKIFWFRPFFDLFSNMMDQKNAPSQKICLPKKSVFSCPSTTWRNMWYPFTPMLYFHTFMSELQIAPIIPMLGINVPNLVQGHLRTCYLLIWVRQHELWRSGLH